MATYLARIRAAENGRGELVGFFVAPNLRALANIVDECCDVDEVEVTKIGAGGIYWPDSVAQTVPVSDDEDDPNPFLPPNPSISDQWAEAMMDEEREWTPLEWGDGPYPGADAGD